MQQRLNKIMSEAAKKLGIDAEFVLGNLKHFASKKKSKMAKDAIKANELLGKHLKLFHDDKVDLTVSTHRETIKMLEELE